MLQVISYSRVSTQDQAEEGVSLDAQDAKNAAYAALYDLNIIAFIRDAGESGKNLKRPGIQRAIAMLRNNEADGIIVIAISRLTRNQGDGARLIEEFFSEKAGKQLFSVNESINTKTATGRLFISILLAMSAYERELTIERTIAALDHKKRNGHRVGNVLYGYTLSEDGKTLVPDTSQQQAISLMNALRADGWSLRRIAAELDKQGFPSQSGRPWSVSAINRILRRT